MSIVLYTAAGAVTLKENYDAYEKGIDITQGPWVQKEYLCEDWALTDAVINTLMGSTAATTNGGPIIRVNPHQCPESPNLYCVDARCVPQAELDLRDGGRPQFSLGIIQARYAIPQRYDFGITNPDPLNGFTNNDSSGNDTGQPFVYAMQSIDFDTEVIKLPGSAYTFASAPMLNVDVPVAMTIGVATMVFTRKLVPYFPVSLLLSKMNKLNASTFLGQPKGQIKFLKGRTRRELSTDNTRTQEIELIFKWREFDHNKFHRPDESSFDFIKDGSGNMPYSYADLTPLLQ